MHTDTIQVYRDAASEWRWRRIAPNGLIIADSSEGYTDQQECLDRVIRVNGYPYDLELHLPDGVAAP